MIDERELLKHNIEMAEAMDFLLASTKRNIESCPYATRQEKDAEIHQKELLMNMLKQQMGL